MAGHDGPAAHPIPLDQLYGRQPRSLPPAPATTTLADRRVPRNGHVPWAGHTLYLGVGMSGQIVHIIHTTSHVEIFDHDGVQIGLVPWPQPDTPRGISVIRSTAAAASPPISTKRD